MTAKQINFFELAKSKGMVISNIESYQNKDSVLQGTCDRGHVIEGSVDNLLKTDFECLDCLHYDAVHIGDTVPFFLSLDAASYTTGMSVLNRKGQVLGHKAFHIDKKKDFFTRVKELRDEVLSIIKTQNIKCVILEDIQYQQNPALFKKLAMLQGVIRYAVIHEADIELITAMADEWRSFNHISGTKRKEQKEAAINKAQRIFGTEISEDESESIFLGYYGVELYNRNQIEED